MLSNMPGGETVRKSGNVQVDTTGHDDEYAADLRLDCAGRNGDCAWLFLPCMERGQGNQPA